MILECSCGKMYRYTGAGVAPTTCRHCGGKLKVVPQSAAAPAPAPAAPPGPDPRLRDLESKLGALEKGQAASREALQAKEQELEDAYAQISTIEADLEEARAGIKRLGDDLAKAQAAYKEALTKKEGEIEEKLAKLSRLEKDVETARDSEGRLDEARAEAERKDEDLAQARTRIEALENELRESNLKAAGTEAIGRMKTDLETERSKVAALQKRADHLEQIRQAEHDSFEVRVRSKDAVNARVGEARYLAADLDRSLESISSSLGSLTNRVKRLVESLHSAGAETSTIAAAVSVAAPSASPPRPPPVAEPAPAYEDLPSEPAPEPDASARTDILLPPPPAPAEPAREEFATIESLPAQAPDELPADETLLDLGRVRRGRLEPSEARQDETKISLPEGAPVDAVPLISEPGEDRPAGDEEAADFSQPVEEGVQDGEPGSSAGPRAGRRTERHSEAPKKKGFFGKLFGKKK